MPSHENNPFEYLPTYDLRNVAADIRNQLQERRRRTPDERRKLAHDCELVLSALIARLHHNDSSPGSPIYQMQHLSDATFRKQFMPYYDLKERDLRLEMLGMAAGCVFGRPFEKYRAWEQYAQVPGGGCPYTETSASREGLERSLEALEIEREKVK